MSPSPLRCAVVGVGYWGPNFVRNLSALPETDLVMVCDRDASALDRIARQYPAVETSIDLHDVLEDPSIDAVVIATPISTHHRLAEEALRAGKHVLVEKPLAGTSEDASELIRLADERRLTLMPGHTFLYSPPVRLVRDYICNGELGEIYFISMSRVNLGLHQQDVSVAWDLGPHDVSILHHWLGEAPSSVNAISRACIVPAVPDVAFIDLSFPSGAIAHVELSWLAPSKIRRTTVVGSRKMVVYDDTSVEPVRVFDAGAALRDPQDFGEYRMSYRTGDIVSPHVEATEPLAAEIRDFVQAVRTSSPPRSTATLGLDVVLTIEAVERSLAGGGVPIEVGGALPMLPEAER